MKLGTEPYLEQAKRWPATGRHILAHFDDTSIVVYQAYRPSIGRFAVEHGRLGGEDFSFARMSWIKPNFLWMMFRSGWGTKPGQEMTLGLRLRRPFFDRLLGDAVVSSWDPEKYPMREEWQRAIGASSVRLQCDPDHDPSGMKLERRAIQLGLRGEMLEAMVGRELLEIIDLTEFVAKQRVVVATAGVALLLTPREHVYRPTDSAVATRLGLESN